MAKPADWDDKIDVTGYFFLNEGSRGKYEPSEELASFLKDGKPPVYLGELPNNHHNLRVPALIPTVRAQS